MCDPTLAAGFLNQSLPSLVQHRLIAFAHGLWPATLLCSAPPMGFAIDVAVNCGLVCEVDATLHALFINCREGLQKRLAFASDIIVDCVLFAV